MIYKRVILACVLLSLIAEKIDGEKQCTVRASIISREVWNHWTGFYCYEFTNNNRLNFRYNTLLVNYKDTKLPGTKMNNGTYFWYDFENTTSLAFIKSSFLKKEFFQSWVNCSSEAATCCDDYMNDENIYPSERYPCPAIWDGWSCFAPAKANTVEKLPCPEQAYSNQMNCESECEKECFANGTWNQRTNYTGCACTTNRGNEENGGRSLVFFSCIYVFFCLVLSQIKL